MPKFIAPSDFFKLFKKEVAFLDVRAPAEYAHGRVPGARNLPLLNNQQREDVGLLYRKSGRDKALELGHKMISGETKDLRIASWRSFCDHNKNPIIYCHRGGLRSKIVQQWLAESGIEIPVIQGGYKALRQFFIRTIEKIQKRNNLIIIAGKTGSAKTQLINSVSNSIDLEGLANHRGSAFGPRIRPQPSQADFENEIATQYIYNDLSEKERFFLEDESRAIGSISIPLTLFEFMKTSKLALIEVGLEERIETILNDYIISNYNDYVLHNSENAALLFTNYLTSSLQKIKKRLGGKNFETIKQKMNQASKYQFTDTFKEIHRDWIQILLLEYYDPMYEYQLNKKADRIVFKGSRQEFHDWCRN